MLDSVHDLVLPMFVVRSNHPYKDAPRLADAESVDVRSILPGNTPIEIEIGCGRGGFITDRAVSNPDLRMIGFEIRLKWASLVDQKLHLQGLSERARVFNADAVIQLQKLNPEASVRRFFIHFPDPWWKKKHQKRLVVRDALVVEICRLLENQGELFVQTDVEERALQYEATLSKYSELEPFGDSAGSPYLHENPYGAKSPREHHAIADGIPIWRLRYRRKEIR